MYQLGNLIETIEMYEPLRHRIKNDEMLTDDKPRRIYPFSDTPGILPPTIRLLLGHRE